jgi:DNA sulfur modification protein DndD
LELRYVELYNWTSYWNAPFGEEGATPHCFDFNSQSGNKGYAIFGENSRGKSSFTDAVQWLLFGKAWTKPVSTDGGRTQKKTLRPLVGNPRDQNFPLLNTTAFLEENFNFFVKAIFVKDGDLYQLSRVAGPIEEGLVVEHDDDMEVSLQVKNASTGEIWEEEDAQDFIDSEILPEKLSRFFFIDGESVTEYRALIASKEENVELRSNIEDILNFPVLKKGISDFNSLKNDITAEYARNTKSTTRNKKLLKEIKEIEEDIKRLEITKSATEKLLKETKLEKSSNEAKMSGFGSAEKNIIERDKQNIRLEAQVSRLEELYDDRREDNQDLWLFMLQKSVKNEIRKLLPELKRRSELIESHRTNSVRLSYLENLSKDESLPCQTCNQLPIPRNQKQIEKDNFEKEELESKLIKIEEMMEENNALEKKKKLEQFRAFIRADFSKQKKKINKQKGLLEDIESKLSAYESAIDDIDEDEVAKVRKIIKNLEVTEADCRAKIRRNEKDIEELVSEKSSKNRLVIEAGGTALLDKLNKKVEVVRWLEDIWTAALDRFSQKSRVEVESTASAVFKQLTNNPEGFSKIILNENFGLTVLDSNDLPVQNPTPGMMQVAAISLIDALGLMSNIEFPILFDTPGQSIDQGHRENIIEHYWSERSTQFIIIPSSGEFRANEVEAKYEKLIARTWELDFDNKENKTTVRNRVIN